MTEQRYSFQLALSPSEVKAYFNLRQTIFCHEQRLFIDSDEDDIDQYAYPIVAIDHASPLNGGDPTPVAYGGKTPLASSRGTRPTQWLPSFSAGSRTRLAHEATPLNYVVGVVRIYESQPRLWYGGRLGVQQDYRHVGRIGKGLIYKAVTTANTWGCEQFLATVQLQNVRFFKRLHWKSLSEITLCGLPHHLMEADLNYYPPGKETRPVLQLQARAS